MTDLPRPPHRRHHFPFLPGTNIQFAWDSTSQAISKPARDSTNTS